MSERGQTTLDQAVETFDNEDLFVQRGIVGLLWTWPKPLRAAIAAVLVARNARNMTTQTAGMYAGAVVPDGTANTHFKTQGGPQGAPPNEREIGAEMSVRLHQLFRSIEIKTRAFVAWIGKLPLQASGRVETRVMRKIEAASLRREKPGLAEVPRSREDVQPDLAASLDTIERIKAQLLQNLGSVTWRHTTERRAS